MSPIRHEVCALASRKSKVAWEALSDDDLLHLRICDLKVQIKGTDLELRVRQFEPWSNSPLRVT